MSDQIAFRHWLRQRRKEYDLTQEALAERVGCSVVTIRRIEEGVRRPSRQMAELLAAGLDMPAHERTSFVQWARTDVLEPGNSPARLALGPPNSAPNGAEPANPYKGLRAFRETDAPDFFGRETLTAQLLSRFSEGNGLGRFLAVVGPSGSGKSSVVRAGMIPALRRSRLPGGANPLVVDIVPGTHPLEELEAALLRVAVNPPPSLLEQLRSDERGLVRAVKRVLPASEDTELLLVLDQFEEIFTLVPDEAARTLLLDNLYAAVIDPRSRMWVIATLRADFYDRPLLYERSSELLGKRTEVVGPMSPAELNRAIVGPAERVGLTLETDLIPAIQQEVAEQPGALPLLQYALTELFERRAGRVMTLAAYRETGGVLGALARRAEAIYAELDQAEREETRQLFLRLTTPGEGVEDMRRRVRRMELASAARDEEALDRVLEVFGRYRFLTFDRDPVTRGPTVEVAHEALIRTWPRVREWLDASRVNLRIQRQLQAASTEWTEANRDPSFLAAGGRLANFQELAQGTEQPEGVALTGEEREYLAASIEERGRQEEAEQQRQAGELALQKRAASRLRNLVAGLGVFLLVAVVLTTFAFTRQAEADTQRRQAQNSSATAVANGAEANKQREQAQANFTRAEAQRLAVEANVLLQERGDPSLIALLSLRAMNTQYSPQGDTALAGAAIQDYPLQVYAGHTDQIKDAAFSPDGKTVLTAGYDGTARMWDAQGGHELPGPRLVYTGTVWAVAYAPDGKTLLISIIDEITWSAHSTRLLDAMTGQELRRFVGHTDWVYDVAYAPDGKTVFTAGWDKTVRMWDPQTGRELRTFVGHTGAVRDLALAADGKTLLTGSFDHTARLWDVETGQELRAFTGHTDEIYGVAFAPDSKTVLTGSADKTARLWDVETGQELRAFTGHTDEIYGVAFAPNGKMVLTGSADKTARLWDVETGRELHRLIGHTDAVNDATFSPDGRYILTASFDRTARLWETQARPDPPLFTEHTGAVNVAAFAPDGKTLLTGSADSTARLWDAHNGIELHTLAGHTGEVTDVAYAPDGRSVLTAGQDNTARLWDAQTGQELRAFTGHTGPVNSVVFSPDGKMVLTASDDKTARLWDAATGQEIRAFTGHFFIVHRAVFSPDAKFVLTTGGDFDARLWDVQTGATVGYFTLGLDFTAKAILSPDGKTMLAGFADGTARVWDAQAKIQPSQDLRPSQELRAFTGHTGIVTVVAFSPDGRYVLTGSTDKTARLWDAATGQELHRFTGHTDTVNNAELSPDGRYVLTGSADKTARLWDAATGQELRRFAGHIEPLNTATYAPDGKHVLTASGDGTARMWDIDYHTTMESLCARLLRDFTDVEGMQYEIKDKEPTCPK